MILKLMAFALKNYQEDKEVLCYTWWTLFKGSYFLESISKGILKQWACRKVLTLTLLNNRGRIEGEGIPGTHSYLLAASPSFH